MQPFELLLSFLVFVIFKILFVTFLSDKHYIFNKSVITKVTLNFKKWFCHFFFFLIKSDIFHILIKKVI